MMPEGGAPVRAKEQSALSGVTHEPLTADYFVDYVEEKFGELYGI